MSVLFDSIGIRDLTLRNRFVRSATYDGCAEKNGHVSKRQLEIYEELARGGVGLIITGITYAHSSGQISVFQNSLAGDDCIPGFRKLAETVHHGGAKIAVPLFHALISLCRPLIREPGIINDWKNKDRHRATCISCNKCFEALLKGEGLHCVIKKETEGA